MSALANTIYFVMCAMENRKRGKGLNERMLGVLDEKGVLGDLRPSYRYTLGHDRPGLSGGAQKSIEIYGCVHYRCFIGIRFGGDIPVVSTSKRERARRWFARSIP